MLQCKAFACPYGAFKYCTGLTSITIPDSVTTIGQLAFSACSNLTCVTIGSNVDTIESNAFAFCSSLTDIYFKGNAPSFGESIFYGLGEVTVYYIPGTIGWGSTFGGMPTAEWLLSMADVDMDGDVNLSDFAMFAAVWQAISGEAAYNPLCDISDPAGVIDAADLAVFADNWLITPCQ